MIPKLILAVVLFLPHLDLGAQIPNAGFENWYIRNTPPHDTVPTGWTAYYGAGLSPDAFTGNFALSTWNWYGYASGWAALGNIRSTSYHYESAYLGGVPYTSKPHHLYGRYRFDTTGTGNHQGVDSAAVVVIAKKYNAALQKIDTVAVGVVRLGPSDTYRSFAVEIEDRMPGTLPDSIAIGVFNCLGCICDMSARGFNYCLYFTVDDLSFDIPAGLQEATAPGPGIKIWPNPAHDIVRIVPADRLARLELYNMLGVRVASLAADGAQELTLPVADLPTGIYFLKAFATGKRPAEQYKILVQH